MIDYEVAFSLLGEDEPLARAIQALLPTDVRSFLYSMEQRELQSSGDGLEAFPLVFRHAQLCVILHRDAWGTTRWTRLEMQTIADRCMEEGVGFLVLVRLSGSTEVPTWFPRTGLWIDFTAEGAERTAEYIAARLRSYREREGLARVTARTYGRQPAPIARYQAQKYRIVEQYTPVRPEVCDDCTAAVQYRPLVKVKLPEHEHWPAINEQFCASCALKRGVRAVIPPGQTKDDVYASENPSFKHHVGSLLRRGILASLSEDAELRQNGVSNVGAAVTASSVTLLVSGSWQGRLEIPLPLHELDESGVRTEIALWEYAKERVMATLQDRRSAS